MINFIKVLILSILCTSFMSDDSISLEWKFQDYKKIIYDAEMIQSTNFFVENEMVNKSVYSMEIDMNEVGLEVWNRDIKSYEIDSNGNESIDSLLLDFKIQQFGKFRFSDLETPYKEQETQISIMFPFSKKVFHKNDSIKIPVESPFNFYGNTIMAKGFNTIIYKGDNQFESKIFAENNSEEFPDITYKHEGTSNFTFNSQKGFIEKYSSKVTITAESEGENMFSSGYELNYKLNRTE